MLDIKTALCESFCGALEVNRVPAGFAISTGHEGMDGDPVGFYIVGPNDDGLYRVQDDGMYMTSLESAGGDIKNKTRLAAFKSLCEEYGVTRENESGELATSFVSDRQVSSAALRFLTFLLRVQDLVWMSNERAANTFREEATKLLREIVGQRAQIIERFVVSDRLKEVPADLGIVLEGRPPVALFFGVSDAKLYEALLLQTWAQQAGEPCAVMAMLETENSVSGRLRQLANNHLTAVPNYRGEERAACIRIVREALGNDPTLH